MVQTLVSILFADFACYSSEITFLEMHLYSLYLVVASRPGRGVGETSWGILFVLPNVFIIMKTLYNETQYIMVKPVLSEALQTHSKPPNNLLVSSLFVTF